jgi:excisionase family DNA binding protein
MQTEADELLTADDVAGTYKVSRQTVGRWAREGILPTAAITPGGQRRFRRSDVEELLAPGKAS